VTLLETKTWREFCEHIGRPDLVPADETPADRLGTHGERARVYGAVLAEYCAAHTWEELLQLAKRTGIAVCPVAAPDDAVELEQVAARELIVAMEHPIEGRIPQLANPLWRAGLARKTHTPAPALSQHTREILEALGYRSADIERLKATGAIGEH
jgi:crotonobetainyl-CoA:carnitine CoA-transferase CaiB-like acyl-CoA transferase